MNGMADVLPVGERIARARGIRRWSQQELADRLRVSRKTVDNWENGRTRPSRSTLGAIEDTLGALDDGAADPLEQEIRDLGERLGLTVAEQQDWVDLYRARSRRAS
jgi:transcriptional regulator with XRE-family HTH domain